MTTINAVNNGLSGATGTVNFVGSTSPTLITPVLGVATATSLSFSPTTGGIVGTTTNDNVASGDVGQFVSSQITFASPVGLTTITQTDVTSISLTAGDWDVWGNVGFTGATNTSFLIGYGWINNASASIPDTSLTCVIQNNVVTPFINGALGFCVPSQRFSLSTTTTIYLSVFASFSVSTCSAFGLIAARRRR